MRRTLLSLLAMLFAGLLLPATAQLQVAGSPQRLDRSQLSSAPSLTLSSLPAKQCYNAQQDKWWQRTIPATRDFIIGNFIQDSYNNAMYPTTVTGMYMMSVAAGTTDNQILLKNMFGAGRSITATIDQAAGTLTIPSGQVVGTLEDGSVMRLYLANFDENHYYNDPMVARISPRGIIYMPQALVIATGTTSGQIRCYSDVMYKMNASQTDYSIWKEGDNKVKTYPVHFSRINNAQILIKNFYGMGYAVNGTVDTVGKISIPYTQVAVGTSSTGTNIVLRNYNVTTINYNTTPPTPTCNSSGTPANFVADSIVTGPYCVAGSTTANRADLVLKSVIKVQASDAFKPLNTALSLPGSGTKEDPYRIATAADLLNLSVATNYNTGFQQTVSGTKCIFPDAYFVQTADIDMSNVENFEPVCAINTWGWGGHYDGQNHTIANLTVKQTRGSSYRAGLFGEISKFGSVKNLKIANATISSTNGFVGAVCGQSYGLLQNIQVTDVNILMDNINSSYCGGISGTLINNAAAEDCSVSGSIKGNNFVGGIAGNNNGAKVRRCSVSANIERTPGNEASPTFGGIQANFTRDTAMVEDCVFTGTITVIGNEMVGGILGQGSSGKGQVVRCWNGGQIMHRASSSSTAKIGGLVGEAKGTQILDCLNTGIVQSYLTTTIGGAAGDLTAGAAVKRTLVLGSTLCAGNVRGNEVAGAVADGCTIENSYYDIQAAFNYGTANGVKTAELSSGQLPAGFTAGLWELAAGKYPFLKRFASHERAAMDRAPIMLANNENIMGIRSAFTLSPADGTEWYMFHNGRYMKQGNGLKIDGNNVTVTATAFTSDTIVAVSGIYFRLIPVKVTPKEFDGDGTEASPYLIHNKAELDRVFKAVDVDLYDYSGTWFRLVGDIDFTGVTDFTGYSHNAPAYAFNGVLDGNGHCIKNLKMATPTTVSSYGSFLLYTGKNSVIKNLTFDSSCQFKGGSNVAPFIASYGRLENIVNLASVTSLDNNAAGIAALVYAGSDIIGCYNAGEIRGGHRYTAGIAAQLARGASVQRCQNSGNVIASQGIFNEDAEDIIYVGGIVGDGEGSVHDCLNQGMISGYAQVGGIAGSYTAGDENTMMRCLNTGVVVETDHNESRGAIMGSRFSVTADRVKDNSFDAQFAYNKAAANADMDGASPLTTSILTSGQPVAGLAADIWQYEAGKYPVLKAFAAQPASQWYAAVHVDFAESPKCESRFDKRSDATITVPQGSTSALTAGTSFSIVNGTTLRHQQAATVATDTLVLASQNGNCSIKVPLFATPRLLANGDGSAQNPWIINNADDWNNLAFYSSQYKKGFDNEYFRLGGDLNFANGFEAICLGKDVYFNGIIDGNGKTIRNLKTEYDADNQKYVGLIGSGGAGAKVYNLTIDASCSFTGNQYVGAVAGHFEGEIHNVTNRATVSTTKMQYAGGIAGELDGNGYVHDCVNYGTITSQNNSGAGGIVGQQYSASNRVENCINHGAVNAKGSCGGIAGTGKGSLAHCTNYGDITSSSTNPGGILGYFWCITDTTWIVDCKNYGTVKATGNAAGGIAGYLQGSGKFRDCYNEGAVTSGGNYAGGILGTSNTNNSTWRMVNVENRADIVANAYAGGILGYSNGTDKTNPATIDTAANYGNVKTLKTNYAGGIAGNVSSYVVLKNVYNYGDQVSSFTTHAGGIAGRSTGSVINAYNHADVTSTTHTAGGIVGESNTSTTTDYGCSIANVINAGHVQSAGTTDANALKVGGILGYGRATVENAVNRGDVKGRKSVGGIVGLPIKGKSATVPGTVVRNSYTSGRVECMAEANAKTCGIIMGDNTTAVTYTVIENCYYDSQMAGKSILPAYADAAKEAVKGLPTQQLFTASLGDGFRAADNCYPMPAVFAGKDFATMASAAVILADGDNADQVSGSFKVSLPQGAAWSAPGMTFSQHGTAIWSNADLTDRTPVTIALGNHRHNVFLQLTSATGVNTLQGDEADILEVQYYNLSGIRVAEPADGVTIRVTIYKDGTRRTERIMTTAR